MSTLIGVDIGGTKTALARYNAETFDIEAKEFFLTNAERTFPCVLKDVVAAIESLRIRNTIGIGVGVPGLVRHADGVLVTMANIPGAEEFPLQAELQRSLRVEVAVANDAQCFALAEAREGAGRGKRVVVGLTLGTGVGGGIIVDGKIYRGAHGYAAEVGHMLLRPGKPPFATSDRRGDVEQFLSGTALGKRCAHAQKPQDYLEGEACAFLHPDVFTEIAWTCVSLTHLIDPDIIIFGGSTGRALKPHLPTIRQALQKWSLPKTPQPELAIAELPDAGTRGAAMLVSRTLEGCS